MPFLHSNISFGTLIRKQAFQTRLSRIFHPYILVPHFPVPHFRPLHIVSQRLAFYSPSFSTLAVWCLIFPSCIFHPFIFDRHAFFGLAFSVVPWKKLIHPRHETQDVKLFKYIVGSWLIYICVAPCNVSATANLRVYWRNANDHTKLQLFDYEYCFLCFFS